jgi:NADPH2:quinone reductase
MAKGIQIAEVGGVEKLKYVDIPDHKLQAGEVRIRQTAIGVNYIDIYYRSGLYKAATPCVLGVEAAGVVSDVGAGVENFKIGERVAYGTVPNLLGAYSTYRNIPAAHLVTIPPYVDDATREIDLMGEYTIYGEPTTMYEVFDVNTDIKIRTK